MAIDVEAPVKKIEALATVMQDSLGKWAIEKPEYSVESAKCEGLEWIANDIMLTAHALLEQMWAVGKTEIMD